MQTRAKLVIEPIKAAWIAGFLDGEAYIGITRGYDKLRKKYYYHLVVTAAQVYRDPVEILKAAFGGTVSFRKNEHRNAWSWVLYGRKAVSALQVVLPYLIVKKKQAELALEYWAVVTPTTMSRYRYQPVEVNQRASAIWAAMCELNGGKALQAERLSEEAPTANAEGGAIVRSHGKNNRESRPEMDDRLLQ